MLTLFQSNGPLVTDDANTKFVSNEFSWNNRSSVLYIDSPAGVGYSYAGTP
jgi:carboxypeptidase C (cathepsin A)